MSDNRATQNNNGSVVQRIRALLRKAESTEFPQEAEALLAKAQELITRHAVDEDDLDDRGGRPGVGHVEIPLAGSYTYERAQVWVAVASTNRCLVLTGKVHRSRRVKAMSLVGRPSDRQIVELLARSLERQALIRLPDGVPGESQSSVVRRRRSYLLGFAWEVSQRLKQVADTVAGSARASRSSQTSDGTSMDRSSRTRAYALRSLEIRDELDDYVRGEFTTRKDRSRSTVDPAAFAAGESAADVADLGQARLHQQQRLGA